MRPVVTTESPKVIKSAEKKEAAIDSINFNDKIGEEIGLKTYRESEIECYNRPLERNYY